MRKPERDYRKLRLRNWNTDAFRHLNLLLWWLLYFLLYGLTERWIPLQSCHLIHCPLDDRIPFVEGFALLYVSWYGLIAVSLAWFLLYNVDGFRQLQRYIIIVQLLATAVFVLYPSRQALRPEVFPRENFLTDLMGWIYRIDTPTGVFPSLHVAVSVGIAAAWLRERSVRMWIRLGILALCVGICMSVAFVKQHSVLDILGAIPLCAAAYWLAFPGRGS